MLLLALMLDGWKLAFSFVFIAFVKLACQGRVGKSDWTFIERAARQSRSVLLRVSLFFQPLDVMKECQPSSEGELAGFQAK